MGLYRGDIMKLNSKENWNEDFEHDGLLYLAQRIEEMLYHYTNHLYKMPLMNTYLLIEEYLHTSQLVDKCVIHEEHLKYIMEEFQDTFVKDVVIKDTWGEKKVKEFLQKINESSQKEQKRLMEYLYHVLKNYNNWCREYLRNIVKDEREKKKIESALRLYLSGLIGGGYSQEYIYYYSKKVFFEQKVNSLEVLESFLKRFDFQKRRYIVYMPVKKEIEKFRDILEKRIGINFEVGADEKELKCDRKQYKVVSIEIDALDEKKAAEHAFEEIDLFLRYYKFMGDKKNDLLYKKGMVKDEEGNCGVVALQPLGYNCEEDNNERELAKTSEMLITLLIKTARCSFPQIDKCIKLHNLAISSSDLKNGFLNFWSILEIVCVKQQNESKIKEVEKGILPILEVDYIHTVFEEIDQYLKECLSNEDYNKLVEKLGEKKGGLRVAKLLLLHEQQELRKDICTKLTNYPLVRSRIMQLNEKYGTKKGMLEDVERFSQRVKWHLRRLYRTRNAIIHSGEEPENLKFLGEHLHSYVDQLLLEIAIDLSMDRGLCTIDNVLIDISFSLENIIMMLKTKEKFNEKDVKNLFSKWYQA